jgi:hypothetical protein
VKTTIQHEGKIHTYDRFKVAGVTEGYERLEAQVAIDFSEVPGLIGDRLAAKLDQIAEQMAQLETQMFYRKHKAGCDEVGTSTDALGAPLTGDLLLAMMEKVEMQFGPDNQPLHKFSVHPSIALRLQEIQEEPGFRARYEALLERKRDVWRHRQSDRKLVD